MHPVCCPVLSSTSPAATHAVVFTFRTQLEPTCLSLWLSQLGFPPTIRKGTYFPAKLLRGMFQPYTDELTHAGTRGY
jgi:hypothetical protein